MLTGGPPSDRAVRFGGEAGGKTLRRRRETRQADRQDFWVHDAHVPRCDAVAHHVPVDAEGLELRAAHDSVLARRELGGEPVR